MLYCDNLTLAGIITVLAVVLFTLRTMARGSQFGWSILSWRAALSQRFRQEDGTSGSGCDNPASHAGPSH